MKAASRLLVAVFVICTPLLARAQIVQVTLSGTITSISGGYTSPSVGVGSTYTWNFSYDSSRLVTANPFGVTPNPIPGALYPFTSSVLTIGSDTWTLTTKATSSSQVQVILVPTSGGMSTHVFASDGPDIPTVPVDATGEFLPTLFSWDLPTPTLTALPTAAQLTTLVSAGIPGSNQRPAAFEFSARGLGGRELTATDTNPAVSINGVLVQAPPAAPFTLAPATLSFADQAVGTTSATQMVTLTNASTASISLGAISVSNGFSQSNDCMSPLAAGAQCTIMVSFSPTSAGQSIGAVTIPYGGANYLLALSGVAPVDVTISASVSTSTVGNSVVLTWNAPANSNCVASSSSSTSPWSGNVPATGSATVSETTAGTDTYTLQCTAPGTPTVTRSATVVWTWPPVGVTLSVSPTTITAGQSTTVTWSASNATTCSATGGGSEDGWSGTKSTSGTQTVTEPVSLSAPSVTLTFGITCTSSISGLSNNASASLVVNQAPAKSGGGGKVDLLLLCGLLGMLVLQRIRAKVEQTAA